MQSPVSAMIWSTDFKLGHLPAVCVRTGQPADASVKFRFVTTPTWAYFLFLLVCTGVGLILTRIIMRLVSRSATGWLPYVRAEKSRIRRWRWGVVAAMITIPVLLVLAIIASGWDSTIALVAWSAFLADIVGAFVLWYFILPRVGPGAFVHESPYADARWVQLRRVHPAFAAAVADMYASRWAASQLPRAAPANYALPPPPA